MTKLSLTLEITDTSGDRCDEILGHVLATAFPSASAHVLSRTGDEVDITEQGSLPTIATGWVTTRYAVTADERPDISADAVAAFGRVQSL